MPIGTDVAVEFFGTQDDVTNASNGTVAADAYSVAADIDDWTNDDDAPEASFVFHYASVSAPTAGGYVSLYAVLKNIDSTNDESTPTASDESAHFLGAFKVPNSTSSYASLRATLPAVGSSQVYEFFILNKTDQTISNTWTLKVTPVSIGPHA